MVIKSDVENVILSTPLEYTVCHVLSSINFSVCKNIFAGGVDISGRWVYTKVKMEYTREDGLDSRKLSDLYYKQGKTLQDIGNDYGITRERVRQLMEKFGLTRLRRKQNHPNPVRKHHSLEDYFANAHKRTGGDTGTLRNLVTYLQCSECSSSRNIHIHHINYPAHSMDDIQFLCASCHHTKHRKGMTYEKQLMVFVDHIQGMLYRDIAVKYNISISRVSQVIRKVKRLPSKIKVLEIR